MAKYKAMLKINGEKHYSPKSYSTKTAALREANMAANDFRKKNFRRYLNNPPRVQIGYRKLD